MMNDRFRARINSEYEERRLQDAKEEDRRLLTAKEKCPGIAELLEKRHRTILDAAKSMFSAVRNDPEKQMEQYNAEIRRKLAGGGLPEDYLQPVYVCPQCRDTGYLSLNPPVPCDCRNELLSRLTREAGDNTAEQTFESFDPGVFSDQLIPAYAMTQRELALHYRDVCLRWADSLPSPRQPLLLLEGGSGLGKTYLMNCIADRAVRKGLNVVSVSAYRMLNSLKKACFDRDDGTAQDYFDCDLLCVDDLGMEPLMQNITIEQIFNLLSERLVLGLPTVITTNLTLTDVRTRYNERLFSRFSDPRLCRHLPFAGQDIRTARHPQ